MRITWFGHSAFRLDTGKAVVLIDPFLSGNPTFNGSVEDASRGVTHIVLTHGHDDHVGDAASIAKRTGAQLIANFEICMWLQGQGAENINPGNTGGTVPADGFTVTFTQALHSSGTTAAGHSIYLGNPLGVVIKAESCPVLYHMGDTDLFGDMALINELHRPEIGIVPIGDRFTMSPKTAAFACRRFFNFRKVFPCHYGTFSVLVQSADQFVAELGSDLVVAPKVGGSVEV
jgi:L-ascorbate metabolism protein UlaG (beta-lactamase superfamily)